MDRRCGNWGQMQTKATDELARFHRDIRPALMAFFLRRSRGYAEAEDLTQEVYVRIAASRDLEMQKADAYIFQVAANLLRDRARSDWVRQDYARATASAENRHVDAIDPYRIAAGRETLIWLTAVLAELPERTRRIFLLFRYEQIDQKTIAETFGISVSAVEKHVYRATMRLMEKMGERE